MNDRGGVKRVEDAWAQGIVEMEEQCGVLQKTRTVRKQKSDSYRGDKKKV